MSRENPEGGAPKGPAGRVATVQAQARVTLALAALYALGAVVALLIPHRTGSWLPLHLFLVGSVLLAISAASQLFAVTWAAGPPPPRAVATTQRTLLAVGVAVLAAAREFEWPNWLIGLGGAGILAALVVLAWSLWQTVRHAVQRRFDPSLRTYLVALLAGLVGCGLGVDMAVTQAGSDYLRVRDAHLVLNLLGLVGLVIVGTLPFFSATQLRVKISPRAGGRAQDALLASMVVALGTAVAGVLAPNRALAAIGLAAYAGGLVVVAVMIPALGMKQLRWAGPRVIQLAAGLAWWFAVVLWAAWDAGRGHEPFSTAAIAVLVVGAYAQILAGSVAYLAPVLIGQGHERLTAGFRATRSWVGLVVANAAALALVLGARRVAAVLIGIWMLDAIVRAAMLFRYRPTPKPS